MVFYTGDPHGDVAEIVEFCRQMRLQPADTLVILGDVGANYYLNERDIYVKEPLNACGPTVLCIHGNHECRPAHLPGYGLRDWNVRCLGTDFGNGASAGQSSLHY